VKHAAADIDFQPIHSPEEVDLSRHALVEASAGTGKTYTIEHLVVRLLKEEPDLQLENILLVTFTEKATGELKQRIRAKLEATLENEADPTGDIRRKLSDTLDGFDSAAIATIHGFCHTLLKELPFETNSLFQQEMVEDGPLLEKLLKAQIRHQWPLWYQDRLNPLLALANFSANPDQFIQTVVALVQRLAHDPEVESLIPDPADLDLDQLWSACVQNLLALKSLVPGLAAGYSQLNINSRTKTAIIRDALEPLEKVMPQVSEDDWQLSEVKKIFDVLVKRNKSKERRIDRLVPNRWLKAGDNLEVCPNITAIRDALVALIELFGRLRHVLTLKAVAHLHSEAEAVKARQGWISYKDMVARVAASLTGEGAGAGIREIRKRYRVAFVDEFQDTDDLQWRIFQTLFLGENQNEGGANRLFLIGDPKQAIYGFRGADVFTYLEARQRMKALAGKGRANLYALAVNWRSAAQLVAAFNRLFIGDNWFGAGKKDDPYDIGYTPSQSPPPEKEIRSVGRDSSGRPALNVMDLTGEGKTAAARQRMAAFICREIQHLVGAGAVRFADQSGRERALDYGDIAVLVRGRPEFAKIESYFLDAGIPYTYYRKPGLFQCREAHLLSMILHAVANPDQSAAVRLALLTPFFDLSARALLSLPELPANHSCRRLLLRWHHLAFAGRWGALFQSLFEDSGLVLRHCTEPGWERTIANYRQLGDYLQEAADSQNLDPIGMAALLDSLRTASTGAGADADIHQIEEEGRKVRILTMHVAKGLEFPIVFIAGGLTANIAAGLRVYHTTDPEHPSNGFRKVFDLTAETGEEQAAKEKIDEDKRLYYVALTRACLKLYIPYCPIRHNALWVGPICKFVSNAIETSFDPSGADQAGFSWHATNADALRPLPPGKPGPMISATPDLPAPLLPAQADFRDRKLALESFSSIHHRIGKDVDAAGKLEEFSLSDAPGREVDEPAESAALEPLPLESDDPLPGGTRMGSMFHHIFENIDFSAVAEGPEDLATLPGAGEIIAAAMARYRVDSRWMPQIAAMVAGTLKTPFNLDGDSITLGRLAPRKRRHEMEFFFPLAEPMPKDLRLPGCEAVQGACNQLVLRGFIDLVFEWRGRYYIADWKSNRLPDGYGQAAMGREMAAAGYELQYRLYTLAALRWLQHLLGERFDPQRHFGGALYLFIRGIGTGGQDGVFHVAAEELLPRTRLQDMIRSQIAGLKW
jgi:exodeoxyribonuclease V beta subunit